MRIIWIIAIVTASILLNVAGNEWGAPNRWHPDELTPTAESLVERGDLNPHFFAYGGLGYYGFAAGAIVPVRLYERLFDRRPQTQDPAVWRVWEGRHVARDIRMARTFSALLDTLLVVVAYIIGAVLYDRAVGTLAALMTAVSGSGIVIAHFATVDTSANFWYWMAVLATIGVWKSGQPGWYVAAGLLAGIAAGVKADRAMVLIPLLVAHVLNGKPGVRHKYLALAAAPAPIGFIVANPVALVAPFEFVDGYTRDLFFQLVRVPADGSQSSYLYFFRQMSTELSWPLMVSVVAAGLYAFREVLAGRKRPETIWLFATFLPYYVILGAKQMNAWYVHLLVPGMMVFTAAAFMAALSSTRRQVRVVAVTLLVLVVAGAQINSLAYILEFMQDPRYEAAAWVARNVPAGAIVGTSTRGPVLARPAESVVEIMPDRETYAFASDWHARLEADRPYRAVKGVIFRLEAWKDRWRGVSARRPPYQAWFDVVDDEYGRSPAGLQYVRPDYLILEPRNAALIERLQRQELGYRLVAQMDPGTPLPFSPTFDFLNESVFVFKRESPSALALAVSHGNR